ncbi:glycerophosphodiester phosphodiesterase [Brevibacillus parabrevis]|uniref:glycerophosphodiester phosphodiesterase n=1 Tax=Brevibacillus parabrevis TaxID=54914 RepID=UPI001F60A995|nr:glycerophosphodiester phosphodiesterase family protein [Brevibacillus parabrevis]MDR4997699.1 glycerophosphodiester phosphodiesterase family protein [Brevibacillus parabrevis]
MNICMAHRGWSGKAPENTMTAIRLALAEPAIQAMEIDVQLSSDGVPVLIHDFTLERTTNGSGLVKDHTLEELRQLDAGKWLDEKFAGEKIPTLEEALIAVKGRCRLNIELKATSDMYPGIAEKVLALLEQYGMKQEVCLTSFDHELIRHVRTLDQQIETGLIIYGRPVLMLEQLEEAGASILSMGYPFLNKELAVAAIEKGFKVIAWTLDEPAHIREVMSWHPDVQICTNHPDRMLEFV